MERLNEGPPQKRLKQAKLTFAVKEKTDSSENVVDAVVAGKAKFFRALVYVSSQNYKFLCNFQQIFPKQ